MRIFFRIAAILFVSSLGWTGECHQNPIPSPCLKVSKIRALYDVKVSVAQGDHRFLFIGTEPLGTLIVTEDGEIDQELLNKVFPGRIYSPLHNASPYLSNFCEYNEDGIYRISCPYYWTVSYIAWYNTYIYNYLRQHPEIREKYRRSDLPPEETFTFPSSEDALVFIDDAIDWDFVALDVTEADKINTPEVMVMRERTYW